MENDFDGQFDDDVEDIDFSQSSKDKIIFINKLTKENNEGEEVFEFVEEEDDDDYDDEDDSKYWIYQATLEGNESIVANSKYQTGGAKEQKFATRFNLEPLHESAYAPSAALGALKEHHKKNNSMVFFKISKYLKII